VKTLFIHAQKSKGKYVICSNECVGSDQTVYPHL